MAVVGATGMVGNKFLEVLTERQLPVENYYLFASAKSAGKVIDFMGKPHTVIELTEENVKKVIFFINLRADRIKKILVYLFTVGIPMPRFLSLLFLWDCCILPLHIPLL